MNDETLAIIYQLVVPTLIIGLFSFLTILVLSADHLPKNKNKKHPTKPITLEEEMMAAGWDKNKLYWSFEGGEGMAYEDAVYLYRSTRKQNEN